MNAPANVVTLCTDKLPKRTWHYVQPPSHFEISPCDCGNHKTQWSEFQNHLWCDVCKVDFIPGFYGILGSPIPAIAAHQLGCRFDKVNMATGYVERYDPYTSTWTPDAKPVMDPIVFV